MQALVACFGGALVLEVFFGGMRALVAYFGGMIQEEADGIFRWHVSRRVLRLKDFLR